MAHDDTGATGVTSNLDTEVGKAVVDMGLATRTELRTLAHRDDVEGEQLFNVVTVTTTAPAAVGEARRVAATSACGICGTTSLDEVQVRCAPPGPGSCRTLSGFN